jgi:hypothetical protein
MQHEFTVAPTGLDHQIAAALLRKSRRFVT